MDQAKGLLQSRTFWIAALQAAAGVIAVFATAYPAAGWLLIAKSVLDIYLRSTTTQPISGVLPR